METLLVIVLNWRVFPEPDFVVAVTPKWELQNAHSMKPGEVMMGRGQNLCSNNGVGGSASSAVQGHSEALPV